MGVLNIHSIFIQFVFIGSGVFPLNDFNELGMDFLLIDIHGFNAFHTLFYQLKGDQILTVKLLWVKVLSVTYFSETMA
jgi:hypothetical protein